MRWEDEQGYAWAKFFAEFDCDGATFAFEFWALDSEDAERRLLALKDSARLKGQIDEVVKADRR